MLRTLKFLPVLALAVALSPMAAQARNASHPSHRAQTNHLTVVQGGVTANSFPDSFGG
jgi:hypothetical protein